MNKVGIVAAREFMIHLKRASFWWVTLGVPISIVLLMLIGIVFGLYTAKQAGGGKKSEDKLPRAIGIIDGSGMVRVDKLQVNQERKGKRNNEKISDVMELFNLPPSIKAKLEDLSNSEVFDNSWQYVPFDDETKGKEALEAREIRGLLVIPADFTDTFSARLLLYNDTSNSNVSLRELQAHIRDNILSQHFEQEQLSQILKPLDSIEISHLHKKEAKKDKDWDFKLEIRKHVLPMVFLMAMMMLLLTSNDRMLRGLMEEKENRVMEILLSSVTADQLLGGKLLGLGLLSLVQLGIWSLMGLLPMYMMLSFLDIGPMTLLVFFVFFVLGYLQIATLVLGLGSMGNNLQEANQWTMIVVLFAISPMFFMSLLIQGGDYVLIDVLSYFPLSSPMLGVFHQASGTLTWWDFLIRATILVASILVSIKISAILFRTGILLTGKALTPKEVWRALRSS